MMDLIDPEDEVIEVAGICTRDAAISALEDMGLTRGPDMAETIIEYDSGGWDAARHPVEHFVVSGRIRRHSFAFAQPYRWFWVRYCDGTHLRVSLAGKR